MKYRMAIGLLALAAACTWCSWARADSVPVPGELQGAVERAEVTISPATAARGQTVTWRLAVDVRPGFHAYPTRQNSTDETIKAFVTTFEWPKDADLIPVGDYKESDPALQNDPGIGSYVALEGKVFWERQLVVSPKAKPGAKKIVVSVFGSICDDHGCKPLKMDPAVTLTVSDAPAVAVDSRFSKEVAAALSVTAKPKPAPSSTTESPGDDPFNPPAGGTTSASNASPTAGDKKAEAVASIAPPSSQKVATSDDPHRAELEEILNRLEPQKVKQTTGLSFILAGIFWGAISLVTPCVFPMIPITVSFFLKQSEKEHHRPITMACVYCLTIVVVLTAAAISLLSFFRWLSVNPIMNFALGVLFVAFALSLFGLFDLELPSALARLTSSRERKGGLLGTMFMALTFTIVSFACVAPFLGGFGGTAAGTSMNWPERILGGLAFSVTFASPFFVLALFPGLLKKLPSSGTWLNSVKVVMGFLELAAALNFFRAGELVLNNGTTSLFTYDLVLGMCVALAFLCGLYLLGVYRLPFDTPTEHIGVLRMMMSLLFLGMGLYLLPGLFHSGADGERQRPSGAIYAWFESFLLPENRQGKSELAWTGDLSHALAEASTDKSGHKLVFVDFTGTTCKNCALNEVNVFSKPEIQRLFRPYERVRLFTDTVPDQYYASGAGPDQKQRRADAAANLWFQNKAFGTEQLPLYVILEPKADGKIGVAGVYSEGKINDEKAFIDFLRRPLDTLAGAQARASSMN